MHTVANNYSAAVRDVDETGGRGKEEEENETIRPVRRADAELMCTALLLEQGLNLTFDWMRRPAISSSRRACERWKRRRQSEK